MNEYNKNEITNERVKKVRNRPSKTERYIEERKEIINKLNELTRLNEKNNVFLYELKKNENLKVNIVAMVPLIKKYYKTCLWGYFSNHKKKKMGDEIALLKAIYKNENYDILAKRVLHDDGIEKKLQTLLYFIKK